MKVVIVIQARLGSSRLPKKVLLPILGKTLLERMVERVRASKWGEHLVVATTTAEEDVAIVDICRDAEIPVFRGHPTDLLNRHYEAGKAFHADIVVKIPSDCPLIDPAVIDRVIDFYIERRADFDFVSNLHPATYPDGNDVEVVALSLLEQANKEAKKNMEREHTTPFFWENTDRFRIGNVSWESGLNYSMSHRWTIDYPEDYSFIEQVYRHLYRKSDPVFGLDAIIALINQNPEIALINSQFAGVNWYRHHLDELNTVHETQTRKIKKESRGEFNA